MELESEKHVSSKQCSYYDIIHIKSGSELQVLVDVTFVGGYLFPQINLTEQPTRLVLPEKMKPLLLLCYLCIFGTTTSADDAPIQDMCPMATPTKETPFINRFICKNPQTVTASDFRTSILNHAGDTDNFIRSSLNVVTVSEFPGLNTLGISLARTDLDMDGIVLPHSHPRASELFYVNSGIVIAGFIDTGNRLFQKTLRQGDVFLFPRGLLHFCVNAGFELATGFSVFNSQNPGVASIAGAMFSQSSDEVERLLSRLLSLRERLIDL